MKKYIVFFPVFASASVEVEADDEDEAIDKAGEECYVGLCHHCARNLDVGDLDYDNAEVEMVDGQ